MIASVADNQVLSLLWNIGFHLGGNRVPPPDASFDYNSAVRQLTFIQNLVSANNSWMQIVTTPTEARQAISSNKLAVILSLEMDSLSYNEILSLVANFQVRHVIPIHLANNTFGGSAVYEDSFNTNTYFLNGSFYTIVPDQCLSFRLGRPQVLQDSGFEGAVGAIQPENVDDQTFSQLGYNTPVGAGGHKNSIGLNAQALKGLMRAGLLLDVAHMGLQSADAALSLAEQFQYPMMDSHTGIRDDSDCSNGVPLDNFGPVNERALPVSHARRIAALGGVLGLGTTGGARGSDQKSKLQPYAIGAVY
jgi:hypothetical protein